MFIERGARLLSVMEYAHLLMPMNFPDDESWSNRYGIVSELGVDLLMPVATSAGRYRFFSMKFSIRINVYRACVTSRLPGTGFSYRERLDHARPNQAPVNHVAAFGPSFSS